MQKIKTLSCRIGAVLLLVAVLLGAFLAAFPLRVVAADFMSTTVEEDLRAAGLDLSLYRKNPVAEPQVLLFSELGYTEEGYGLDDGFRLLVYVYNPTGVPLDLGKNNVVNVSVDSVTFENVKLVHIGNSDDALYYRFYLDQKAEHLKAARGYAAAHDGARTYGVAGLQLWDTKGNALKDNTVGKAFTFRGYAKGCHPTTEFLGNLTSSYTGMETISLTLNHTTWRNQVYDPDLENGGFEDEGDCDAVSTVFFGVPEEYIYDYEGGLQQISAEWYEYRTNPIFVTWDGDSGKGEGAYKELYPWIGKTLGAPYAQETSFGSKEYSFEYADYSFSDYKNSLTRRVFWGVELKKYLTVGSTSFKYYEFQYGYNPNAFMGLPLGNGTFQEASTGGLFPMSFPIGGSFFMQGLLNRGQKDDIVANVVPRMDYLFGIDPPTSFEDARISAETLSNYMRWYTNNIAGARDDLVLDRLSANLFDMGVSKGHVSKTVTAGESGTTLVEKDISFWEKFWYGNKTENVNYKVLHVFDFNDITYVSRLDPNDPADVAEFEKRYFVENWNTGAKSGNVLKELQALIEADQVPVLYRFAQTKYTVYNAIFDNTDDWYTNTDGVNYYDGETEKKYGDIDGYVAQETVFLDFDVISLGFDTGDASKGLKIIPVVADPIDVISGLIAPNNVPVEQSDWFLMLVMLLILIVVLILVWPFISPVITVVFNVIFGGVKIVLRILLKVLLLPFKLLGHIFRRRR